MVQHLTFIVSMHCVSRNRNMLVYMLSISINVRFISVTDNNCMSNGRFLAALLIEVKRKNIYNKNYNITIEIHFSAAILG